MAEPLDLNYSPELFVQMMEFLREKLSNFAPLTSHYGGYTYVFKTRADKANFDRLIETDEEQAMTYVFDKWKEGTAQVMNIDLKSGYKNTVLTGQRGTEIVFTFHTMDGGAKTYEPVTVNYTFECNGIRQTQQEQYSAQEEVRFLIDNFLLEGTNNVTIQVRGNLSKVASSITVTYVMSELSVSSNFNVSTEYGSGDDMSMNVVAKGSSDSGDIFVEYYLDGQHRGDMKVTHEEIGTEKRLAIPSSELPTTPGKHTLQLRTRATIGNVNRYSRVWYYEWVRSGYAGKVITIKRELADENIIVSASSLTLQCEQYVTEILSWGFRSSSNDKAEVKWQLVPVAGGDATNVGSADIGGDMAGNEGMEYQLSFLPVDSGRHTLTATVNGQIVATYDVQVVNNTSGLQEASTADMTCRLFSIGRSNDEPADERIVWKYKTATTTFDATMPWNATSGWVDNALQLADGHQATISIRPFVQMTNAGAGVTVEVDFETFNVSDDDAVVLKIGKHIAITANTATLKAPVSGASVTDKFPSNTRVTLAFVVHAKNSLSQPRLMEIINGGVTSRCDGYQDTDSWVANDTIVMGGATGCGIRVYSVRVYQIALNNKQELNNVIVSSDDIATMVRNNDIYSGTEIDVEKIRNRIPCLWVTGHGGTDRLQSIWDSQSKVQIYCDVEWTNPLDGGETNWRCTDMRLRSHGQSTLRNPMKSLKGWIKTDTAQNVHTTQFYNRDSDEPMADPRWAMKRGSMPQTKFVWQCYYIDSSNCKSPALLRIIDETMRAAGIYTEPMRYAVEQYPQDMKARYGEDPSGRGWKFPYDIRYTPDSIPCVLIARDTENDRWTYQGIFVLMDDKKSDYLYGERSIYDCPNDPFCFEHDKKDYETLWDNAGVTRFEYLSNTHPISVDSGVSTFFRPPQAFTPDDDEQDVTTTPGGGESSGATESDATYDFEQALELIYPDLDDLREKKSWPTNYADPNNLTNDTPHANRLYLFKKWLDDCRKANDGYAKFRAEAEDHMDLDQWAAYYCFAMPNGTFDNMVRNLQLTTYGKNSKGHYVWVPLWWDIDIQDGTINTGQLAFDPPVDRQTETTRYGVAFRGQESWLWNALEAWSGFMVRCRAIMNRLNAAGYTYERIIAEQDTYCNTWPEAMYNESQNVKYKQMYLANPSSNARFLYYLLGDGKVFRRWWLKKNWDYWMAYLAAGDAAKNGVAMRWNGGYSEVSVTYGASTFFMWSINDALVILPNGGYSQAVKRGDTVKFIPTDTSNSIYSTVYSAHYILKADYSVNAESLLNANLGNFSDPVLGTMLEELNIGVRDEQLRAGKRNGAGGVFEGMGKLTSLRKLNLQGYTAGEAIDLSTMTHLTHLYMRGSAYTTVSLANSIRLEVAELPTTLTSMTMRNVQFSAAPAFYKPDEPFGTSYTYPLQMTNLYLYGMGTDANVQRMVIDWLKDNNGKESQLTLTLTNLAWTECTYEDIMRIGRIPRDQRSLTGKVKITSIGGEDRNLTNAEMTALSNAFNDPEKGINVFSVNSSFQIDLRAGVIISGPSEIWAGDTAQIIGAVFPLTAGGYQFRFGISRINGAEPPQSMGTTADGWQVYRNTRLNVNTGVIETTETTDADITFDVLCTAYSVEATMEPVTFSTTVKHRIYPTRLGIKGDTLIQSTGDYTYSVAYTPSNVNGTFESAKWSLSGGSSYISLKSASAKGRTTLQVTDISEDVDVTIGYYEEYVANGRTTATPITVSIVYGANEGILYDATNHEVFSIFLAYGQQYAEYKLSSPSQMTRLEARRYTSLPPAFVAASASVIAHFQEIQHFKNLAGAIDLSHTSLRDDILDFTQLSKVTSIDTRNTYASIKL